MIAATFHFHDELADFISCPLIAHTFPPTDTVKHVIESLGVPHAEIGEIFADGASVPLSQQLADGASVHVHPWRGRASRFVLDMHLGRLAAYLRMLGFDCWYRKHADDAELAQIAFDENRVALTRDVALLKRSLIERGYFVREVLPRKQMREIVRRFDLSPAIAPFTRCLECNTPLEYATKEQVLERLPPRTRELHNQFRTCSICNKVYWKGTHWQRMREWIEELRQP